MTSEFEKLGKSASDDPSILGYVMLGTVILVAMLSVAAGLVWQLGRQAGSNLRDMAIGQVSNGGGNGGGGSSGNSGAGTNGGGL